MKIFLIDDNELDLFISKKMLEMEYRLNDIQTYQESEKALQEILNGNIPDLIFLDLNMPKLDGFKFMLELNMHNICLNIIILSSSDKEEDVSRSMQHKCVVKYLIKPLTHFDEIRQYIEA